MFPGLEPRSQEEEEGGAAGAAKILWPLSYVVALVPGTLLNACMERDLKAGRREAPVGDDSGEMNVVFYVFWLGFWTLMTTLPIFWLSILPGYGTVPNIKIFTERLDSHQHLVFWFLKYVY